MIAKLRGNFKLSNFLARTLFVLTFVFANWQSGLLGTVMAEAAMGLGSTLGVSFGVAKIWIALFTMFVIGVIWMFLLPLLVNLLLNFVKIYSVPRAEYCLFVHIFFALGYFIRGCLNLINLFTPAMLVWGSVLFPFVSSLVAMVLFYRVTAKLYFNDLTVVNYFRVCVVVFLVLQVILEVL